MPPAPLILDGSALTPAAILEVARNGRAVALDPAANERCRLARAVVERRAGGEEPVYGVNTGFGSLARHRIAADAVREVQRNLVRSHAAGVGAPLPEDAVRAMLLVLAASLARGHSGVRPRVIEAVLDLLTHGITPIVPSRGSVGASGDLAPLAHAALVLIGEGHALVKGRRVGGAEALAGAGLAPIELQAKEGLALINGTHLMAALGALVLDDGQRVLDAAECAAALAIDACRGSDDGLDDRLHLVRGQVGPRQVAARLRERLAGSQIVAAHKTDDPRVQDPYCLRAIPPVLGAAEDAVAFVAGVFARELGAVTDNPLVFPDAGGDGGVIRSGANFHGLPLALALDLLPIALCHVAGIAERRVYWVLSAGDSENPVTVHLSPQPGLHSGLMIVQYTAAACCNELQTLAAPASVHNIPTSAGMEDYNSMGVTAAHQAVAAVALARQVVACELLVMCQALEHQRPLRSGPGVEATFATVRGAVPRLEADRPPAPDLQAIDVLIRDGAFSRE